MREPTLDQEYERHEVTGMFGSESVKAVIEVIGSFVWFTRRTGVAKRFYLEAKAAASSTAFSKKA